MQSAKRNTDVLLLQQQIKLSEQYYEDLSLSQQRLKGIRHDMKNHLQSLCWMAARITPKSRETEEIQEYLGHLTQDIGEASQILSTGNMGLDAILSLSSARQERKRSLYKAKSLFQKRSVLATEDGIIILGNLLDNAMKACRKIQKKKDGSIWISLYSPYTFITDNESSAFLTGRGKEAGKRAGIRSEECPYRSEKTIMAYWRSRRKRNALPLRSFYMICNFLDIHRIIFQIIDRKEMRETVRDAKSPA